MTTANNAPPQIQSLEIKCTFPWDDISARFPNNNSLIAGSKAIVKEVASFPWKKLAAGDWKWSSASLER